MKAEEIRAVAVVGAGTMGAGIAGEFARELGRAVAEKIVAKIDSDKLLALIKAELFERRRKKS